MLKMPHQYLNLTVEKLELLVLLNKIILYFGFFSKYFCLIFTQIILKISL